MLLSGIILYAAISGSYTIANVWHWREPLALGWTAVDRAIPFVGWTVWVYLSHFALQAWLVLEAHRKGDGAPLVPIAAAGASCLAVFVLLPTRLAQWPWRPEGLSAAGFKLVDSLNTPANSVPSMHVALAALAAAGIARVAPARGRLAAVWAVLVCLSTLTAKQHTAIDVPAGLAIAWLAWWFAPTEAA